MNSSWSRISGSTVLSLSQTLSNDHLSLSQAKCDLSHIPSRSPSPSYYKLSELSKREDIIPSKVTKSPFRPPSFADETTNFRAEEDIDLKSAKRKYAEERELRDRAERRVAQLQAKLVAFTDLQSEVVRLKGELRAARDELKAERGRRTDVPQTAASRETSQKRAFATMEETITELKAELRLKTEEIAQLRTTVRISAQQRSDLLKESELLRQTVAELKSVHRRETAELKAQLASECAMRAHTDRKLAENYVSAPVITEKDHSLRHQVERLEGKLHSLEAQHREQAAISEGVKARVQRLVRERSSRKRKENYEDWSPPLTERSERKPASKSPIRSRNAHLFE